MSRDKNHRRIHVRSAFLGGLVAAMIVSALPAVAAQVGDALRLGEANRLNGQTILRGRALANLTIISDARGDTNGTALDLRVREGNPPMRVNSSDLVEGFNTDLLDGRSANEMIRTAFAVSPEIDEGVFVGGAANILTTTITAPRAGVLIIGASVDAQGATDDQYTCQVLVDGFTVAGSSRTSRVNWQGVVDSADTTDNSQENCGTDAAQVVGPGAHGIDFRLSGRNTAAFRAATLWAIWVPFDATGSVPIEP